MFLEMGDGRGRRRWMIYVSREGEARFQACRRKMETFIHIFKRLFADI